MLITFFTVALCLSFTENLAKAGKAIQAILDATGKSKGKTSVYFIIVVVVPISLTNNTYIRMRQWKRQKHVIQFMHQFTLDILQVLKQLLRYLERG